MTRDSRDRKTADVGETPGDDGVLVEPPDAPSERTRSIEREEEDPERWDGMS